MARHTNDSEVLKQIDLMDEADGTNYDTSTTDDNDDDVEGDEEDTSGQEVDEGEDPIAEPAGKKPVVDAEQPKNDAKAAKETDPNAEAPRKQGANLVDRHNNIVDANGAIIAKAGTERRLFEKTQRLSSALDDRTQRLQKYEAEDKVFDNLRGAIKQHGMSADEFAEGINIVIEFKRDPVAAAKKTVEACLALGHNVTDILGADAGNAIEMSAVSKMLDKRLAPIIQPLEAKRVSEEQIAGAQKAWNNFCEQNDYADVHEEAIDRLLGSNEGMRPQQAYNALYKFAVDNGLDFSLPLKPQVEALQSAPKKVNRQEPRAQKPFVNGGAREASRPLDDGALDSNASWDKIIRTAMPTRN